MSLAVLIPYRPDGPHRKRIKRVTARLWAEVGVEVVHCGDGLTGLFSYARAANLARAKTNADCLLTYSADALPLPAEVLADIERELTSGLPWTTLFDGQRRFTQRQTTALMAGKRAGEPLGEVCMGREALLGIRADVWDDLQGMDEGFVGWGWEDAAWHRVLATVYPEGNDVPAYGLFKSLWHPSASRAALPRNTRLWEAYLQHTEAEAMRAFYLARDR